jgi:exodeoxyribonuclease VII large subunit
MTDASPTAPGGQSNIPEYTVSELAGSLKRTVEEAYGFVRVRGELGRTLIAKSGHLYVDLKDDKAVIASVMWKGGVSRLSFKPEEGLEVVAEGRLTTYPGRSQYQLVIERMAPAGVGALMALLEARKKKLAAEGLFAPERKRRLPYLPEVIGVVTSPTGAVIRDILHRITDRFPRRVLVWPVLVQGEQAAPQVAAAIRGFNAIQPGGRVPRPDVLIVARGGGSIEDLWAFNEEVVVRAAAESDIPLVSAVGHETDWTLIDLAADVRAPTPTGAAEMVVPVRAELQARVAKSGASVRASMARTLERKRVEARAAARGLPKPDDLLGPLGQKLDSAGQQLRAALKGLADRAALRFGRVAGRLRAEALVRDLTLKRRRASELAVRAGVALKRAARREADGLARLAGRLERSAPRRNIVKAQERLSEVSRRLERAGARRLVNDRRLLGAAAGRLEAVNPKAVLGRGYALVRRADGGLARRAEDLAAGDVIALEFADGRRDAVVSDGAGDAARSKGTRPAKAKPGSDGGQGALF